MELLFVVGILAFVLVSMISIFILAPTLSELAGSKSAVLVEGQNKIEEIRNHNFNAIVNDFSTSPGNSFTLDLVDGTGSIYVDNSNTDLLEVEVTLSWEDKFNRTPAPVTIKSMVTKK